MDARLQKTQYKKASQCLLCVQQSSIHYIVEVKCNNACFIQYRHSQCRPRLVDVLSSKFSNFMLVFQTESVPRHVRFVSIDSGGGGSWQCHSSVVGATKQREIQTKNTADWIVWNIGIFCIPAVKLNSLWHCFHSTFVERHCVAYV